MADHTYLAGDNSPEAVALKLMDKLFPLVRPASKSAILDLYAECLDATKGARTYPQTNDK
jgi:hypothetical protein